MIICFIALFCISLSLTHTREKNCRSKALFRIKVVIDEKSRHTYIRFLMNQENSSTQPEPIAGEGGGTLVWVKTVASITNKQERTKWLIQELQSGWQTQISPRFPYPYSERKYFHKALEGEESSECGVHVMQNGFVRIGLFVVLKKTKSNC